MRFGNGGPVLHLAGAAAAVVLAGCGGDQPAPANQPPVVSWVERPGEGATVTDRAAFAWSGTDPDGTVSAYEYSLDSETGFTRTGEERVELAFTKEEGTDSRPRSHVFRVRAVDDRELAGEDLAAGFVVAVINDPPTVSFLGVPQDTAYAGPVVTLSWAGEDPDGTVASYEYAVDDTSLGWTGTGETSVELDFSGESAPRGVFRPAHRPARFTFHLRAVDDEGKRSAVISTSFLSGPENRPPEVTLTAAPFIVTTGSAVFGWTGTDPDGEVVLYQTAITFDQEPVWEDNGLNTELLRSYTRADGTGPNPRRYTFHLRAMDDDSTWSAVASHQFQVAIPNLPPTLVLTAPAEDDTVNYSGVTVRWKGTDDAGIGSYEYAVDDTTGWEAVAPSVTFLTRSYDCPDSPPFQEPPNPRTPVDISYGFHTFFVRAVDTDGARSPVASSSFHTFTRTPFTVIDEPATEDGAVSGSPVTVRWHGIDVDRVGREPAFFRWKAFAVESFDDFPDARDAVLDGPGEFEDLAPEVREREFSGESGARYLLAVWAVDVAGAVEPHFLYGRNVLKISVP